MLAQRRRRWANICPALGQCVVFAGEHPYQTWSVLASHMAIRPLIGRAGDLDQSQA